MTLENLVQERLGKVSSALGQIIKGKSEVLDLTLIALLARGHLLIEDVPGIGKTTLAHALARSLEGTFKRIQFTSDLLPSDLTGVSVFNQSSREFEFRRGPLFANVVLADEINRATPKTQSALLEAMSEGKVTVDDETYDLSQPFMVVATQNPREHHGTYPLPESQLDRFLMRIRIGYPDLDYEKEILREQISYVSAEALTPSASVEEIISAQSAVSEVAMEESLLDYLMAIVKGTRESPDLDLGVSPRGAMALYNAAKARAFVHGRSYCFPDDIKTLAIPVLSHRVMVSSRYTSPLPRTQESEAIIRTVVEGAEVPV